MATKKTATPNQVTAIGNARIELIQLRSLLETARRCVAQLDAQDTTRYFDRAGELKAAIQQYEHGRSFASMADLDAFVR